MKIFQIVDFYPAYLSDFEKRYYIQNSTAHSEIMNTFLKDGFYGNHMFFNSLIPFGYEGFLAISNDKYSQLKWLEEHGYDITHIKNNTFHIENDIGLIAQILNIQINHYKPDILFVTSSTLFDSHFIRALNYKPKYIIGWRAANIPSTVDWTEYDLILSHIEDMLHIALKQGAKNVALFYPGFADHILDHIMLSNKSIDLAFIGQITIQHQKRIHHLLEIGKLPLGIDGEFSIEYFIGSYFENKYPVDIPIGISMYNNGGVWGLEMYQALANAKISFNDNIDISQKQSGNMRLFETTGVGSFQLTEHTDNLHQYFTVGKEIESYTSMDELKEKIYYYLEHEDKREAIAKKGQERCLRDYSMKKRTSELHEIIKQLILFSKK